MSEICANCKRRIGPDECQWESQVYAPALRYILCEPCGIEEDREVEEKGTNVLPHRLERYGRGG